MPRPTAAAIVSKSALPLAARPRQPHFGQCFESQRCFLDRRTCRRRAAPAAIAVLGRQKPVRRRAERRIHGGPPTSAAVPNPNQPQHATRAVDAILFVRRIFIAEPKRRPSPVVQLALSRYWTRTAHSPIDSRSQAFRQIRPPREPGEQRVGRQIGAAAVERKTCPQPRQNVGMPPSRFCRSSSQHVAAAAASARSRIVGRPNAAGPAARRACRRRRARRPVNRSTPSRPARRRYRDAAGDIVGRATSREAIPRSPSVE